MRQKFDARKTTNQKKKDCMEKNVPYGPSLWTLRKY